MPDAACRRVQDHVIGDSLAGGLWEALGTLGRHLGINTLFAPYQGCVAWPGATLGHETVWGNQRRAGGVAELEVYVHDH